MNTRGTRTVLTLAALALCGCLEEPWEGDLAPAGLEARVGPEGLGLENLDVKSDSVTEGYDAQACTQAARKAVPICRGTQVACRGMEADVVTLAEQAAQAASRCQESQATACPEAVDLLNENGFYALIFGLYCPPYCRCGEAEYAAIAACGGEIVVPE